VLDEHLLVQVGALLVERDHDGELHGARGVEDDVAAELEGAALLEVLVGDGYVAVLDEGPELVLGRVRHRGRFEHEHEREHEHGSHVSDWSKEATSSTTASV